MVLDAVWTNRFSRVDMMGEIMISVRSLSSEEAIALAVEPVQDYLARLLVALQRISQQQIREVVGVLFMAWQEGRQVFLFGNGGSAATASHMANDLNKLTITPGMPRMKAIALTDNVPLMTAWGNDTEYANIFAEQLVNFIQPGDVAIGISASGNSPNVLRAMQTASQHQAVCVAFTGDTGGKLKDLADHCIFIPDDCILRQEDGHMILDHVISYTLRTLILVCRDGGK